MNKLISILLSGAALAGAVSLTSCDDNDEHVIGVYANALVTVKTAEDHPCILQLDDEVRLIPVNISKHPYDGKQVRALTSFEYVDENQSLDGTTEREVKVFWLDSILTKEAIVLSEVERPDELGNDPVEIIKDWVTVAEDGYLTLRFRTVWGNGTKHSVNLIASEEEPDVFELRHNAFGDTYGYEADGLVAFHIAPYTSQGSESITLKWKSFTGEKSVKFKLYTAPADNKNIGSIDRASLRRVM